jgi:hypothetical protein
MGSATVKFRQPLFCVTPKVFNAVDVRFSPREFVRAVEHAVVVVAVKNQSVIGFPSVVVLGVFTYAILQGNYHSIKEEKEKNEYVFPE